MNPFSKTQVNLFKDKVNKEKFFAKFVHYNSYLEVTYIVPQNDFKGFKLPQWSRVQDIVLFEDNFILKLSLFNDPEWLYNIETALKYDLITFK